MAPSGKATVQKGSEMSRRSASPPNQPTPVRTRDEPPARSTRSWISAPPVSNNTPTASQRVPIDCPVLGCRAKTVHQHLPQLQYYHSRPGRAVHYRGYGIPNDTSSRPSLVVTLRIGSRDQSTTQPEPHVSEHETAAQEQNGEEQDSANELPTSPSPSVASDLDVDRESVQHVDGVQHLLPEHRNPIHDEGTLTLFQAPMTPPPSSPLGTEEVPSAQNSTASPEEQSEQRSSAPPTPQIEFGDWLPGRSPDNNNNNNNNPATHLTPHIHTYDELIRPLVDPTLPPAPGMAKITQILQEYQNERDLDMMPSLAIRSPLSEYMWQFREESDEDYDYDCETFGGQ